MSTSRPDATYLRRPELNAVEMDGELVMMGQEQGEYFSLLHEHTYRNELVHGPGPMAQHLEQCARLVSVAQITRVRRPVETMTVEATADAILAHIATSPSASKERA